MKHLQQTYDRLSVFHVACPPMKNNDNISMIARSAGCFGCSKVIITGQNNVDSHISREIDVEIVKKNSLLPVLKAYKEDGFTLIGLEQSAKSISMHNFRFMTTPVLFVVGNETKGMSEEIMEQMDYLIEIPLICKPFSLNVAVAASICFARYAEQIGHSVPHFG